MGNVRGLLEDDATVEESDEEDEEDAATADDDDDGVDSSVWDRANSISLLQHCGRIS